MHKRNLCMIFFVPRWPAMPRRPCRAEACRAKPYNSIHAMVWRDSIEHDLIVEKRGRVGRECVSFTSIKGCARRTGSWWQGWSQGWTEAGQPSGAGRGGAGARRGGQPLLGQPSPRLAPPHAWAGLARSCHTTPPHGMSQHTIVCRGMAWRDMAGQRETNKTIHRLRFCVNL